MSEAQSYYVSRGPATKSARGQYLQKKIGAKEHLRFGLRSAQGQAEKCIELLEDNGSAALIKDAGALLAAYRKLVGIIHDLEPDVMACDENPPLLR